MAVATSKAAKLSIRPEKNEFDDHILDVFGNEFKFDHAKGLAEWIKNSADAYSTTAKVKDAEQFVVLRFLQASPKRNSVFECIDFVGMTTRDIDKALKIWGSPVAAKKGTKVATFGGHGNGGKFYMRQMFKTSRYITFRGGELSVFGFDEKRRYGYAKGYARVKMTLEKALEFADIDGLDIPKAVWRRWKKNRRIAGFTAVVGNSPNRFSGRASVQTILDKLRLHPQARRLLSHKQIIYMPRNDAWGERLTPPSIEPRDGFENDLVINLPRRFDYEGEKFAFRDKKHGEGRLILRTSQQPLSRSSDLSAMNAIDIIGEVGCIGSYRMNELGFMRYSQEAEFLYGECECPLLEDKERNLVKNDREKLVDSDLTRALLEWIRQRVDELAGEMAEERRREQKTRDLRQSSLFNQILDRWKNKFLVRLTSELFGGTGIGGSFGGEGGGGEAGGTGSGAGGGGNGDPPVAGGEEGKGGGSGTTPGRGPTFPKVLLSGYDKDPLDDAATEPFDCNPRHPPVYQRDVDISHGIYWINTARPLADRIMDQFGADHPRWREYLFQRYVDIIFKQSIHELGKTDSELNADKIDGLLDDVTLRVHDAAAEDLESFLFDDTMTGSAPAASDGTVTTATAGDGSARKATKSKTKRKSR